LLLKILLESNAMTTNNFPTYLDAHGWAKLLAYLWTRPAFACAFESNPVQAILAAQHEEPQPIDLDYVFDLADPKRRTRLIKLPDNPGYSHDELNDAVLGLISIVPMSSWVVHGVAPQS
jgi:hypothetical protein